MPEHDMTKEKIELWREAAVGVVNALFNRIRYDEQGVARNNIRWERTRDHEPVHDPIGRITGYVCTGDTLTIRVEYVPDDIAEQEAQLRLFMDDAERKR